MRDPLVTCATHFGSRPSRPELKMIRACELAADSSVPKIDVNPAMYARNARKPESALAASTNGTGAAVSFDTFSPNAMTVV